MEYSKPKVTIDLDEYNELKATAESYETEQLPYRNAVIALMKLMIEQSLYGLLNQGAKTIAQRGVLANLDDLNNPKVSLKEAVHQ